MVSKKATRIGWKEYLQDLLEEDIIGTREWSKYRDISMLMKTVFEGYPCVVNIKHRWTGELLQPRTWIFNHRWKESCIPVNEFEQIMLCPTKLVLKMHFEHHSKPQFELFFEPRPALFPRRVKTEYGLTYELMASLRNSEQSSYMHSLIVPVSDDAMYRCVSGSVLIGSQREGLVL